MAPLWLKGTPAVYSSAAWNRPETEKVSSVHTYLPKRLPLFNLRYRYVVWDAGVPTFRRRAWCQNTLFVDAKLAQPIPSDGKKMKGDASLVEIGDRLTPKTDA